MVEKLKNNHVKVLMKWCLLPDIAEK